MFSCLLILFCTNSYVQYSYVKWILLCFSERSLIMKQRKFKNYLTLLVTIMGLLPLDVQPLFIHFTYQLNLLVLFVLKTYMLHLLEMLCFFNSTLTVVHLALSVQVVRNNLGFANIFAQVCFISFLFWATFYFFML